MPSNLLGTPRTRGLEPEEAELSCAMGWLRGGRLPALPVWAQTSPPSIPLSCRGHPAHAHRGDTAVPCPHRHSHPRAARRGREHFLEPLRHAALGGNCGEPEELNGVLHCSACPPPASLPSKVKPTPLLRHKAGTSHEQRRQLLPSPARWEGKNPAKTLWQAGKAPPAQHTHAHAQPGANLQSRTASPCQELGDFPPSPQLAALS